MFLDIMYVVYGTITSRCMQLYTNRVAIYIYVGGAKKACVYLSCETTLLSLCTTAPCSLLIMSALEGFEDLIRDKIENERWTHKQISTFLMESCPGQRGFSMRSIERFCGNKGIHKTSRIDDRSLDVAVSTATAMVRSILRVDRLPFNNIIINFCM